MTEYKVLNKQFNTNEKYKVIVWDICFEISHQEVFNKLHKKGNDFLYSIEEYWDMLKKIAFEKYELYQWEQDMINTIETV